MKQKGTIVMLSGDMKKDFGNTASLGASNGDVVSGPRIDKVNLSTGALGGGGDNSQR